MAFSTDSLILAQDFKNLKDSINKLMAKRNYGSRKMAGYQVTQTADQYELTKASDVNDLLAPYQRMISGDAANTPSNAVSVNELIKPIKFKDADTLVTKYLDFNTYHNNQNDSGCGGYCSGLCVTICANACKGSCSSGCGSECSSDCTGSCSIWCSGCTGCGQDCAAACVSGCKSDCGGGCTSGCNGECGQYSCENNCKGDCTHSCRRSCGTNCQSFSRGACSDCSSTCSDICTACTGNCWNSCKWACTGENDGLTCGGYCLNMCGEGCESSCSGSCFGVCSTTCGTTCGNNCGLNCSTGCKGGNVQYDWDPPIQPIQYYTTKDFVASGSWVVPVGINSIYIFAVGGGGGSAGAYGRWDDSETKNWYIIEGSGGGGGGYVNSITISVKPGDTLYFTVGEGGEGGIARRTKSMTEGGNGSPTKVFLNGASESNLVLEASGGYAGGWAYYERSGYNEMRWDHVYGACGGSGGGGANEYYNVTNGTSSPSYASLSNRGGTDGCDGDNFYKDFGLSSIKKYMKFYGQRNFIPPEVKALKGGTTCQYDSNGNFSTFGGGGGGGGSKFYYEDHRGAPDAEEGRYRYFYYEGAPGGGNDSWGSAKVFGGGGHGGGGYLNSLLSPGRDGYGGGGGGVASGWKHVSYDEDFYDDGGIIRNGQKGGSGCVRICY